MTSTMKAVGFKQHLSLENSESLFDFEMPIPKASGHDLLVKIEAVAVNPIDVSVRLNGSETYTDPKILGWDACGTVVATGDQVTLFKEHDLVFYAGDFKRAGSNAEYQLVDERLVGHAPRGMDIPEIAAMALTSLTAWEALVEKLEIDFDQPLLNKKKTILIINGAGGVGSVATQLAHLAGLHVIATASRPETSAWTKKHGTDQTINHRQNMSEQLYGLGYQDVDYILGLSDIDGHWEEMATMIKPGGRIVSITQNKHPLDLGLLKSKSAEFMWEWVYTKSFYQLPEMITQHASLEKIAALLEQGRLKSTANQIIEGINAENLKAAHAMIETNSSIGKIVLCR
ncbi:zinc-binding alcohol dehydrogenase family protein [Liquorilactobacillus capillatus]|uniref:Zinc-type alcohol dehydrogenase-like protein n=1 Tax=Liquorilactobacillus capillatus DSM 19910 TaxID=1423731 RepID=A0A0R1M221_9LACO|nr:zinc-binding alcohol dehydrogenase family protein [Liquorilactobacillus capillatus]KRL01721.1 NADPH quinone reductase related Zn-dependent oxidoreductase [Liquorilactobacillus capillatus DSM 19910]